MDRFDCCSLDYLGDSFTCKYLDGHSCNFFQLQSNFAEYNRKIVGQLLYVKSCTFDEIKKKSLFFLHKMIKIQRHQSHPTTRWVTSHTKLPKTILFWHFTPKRGRFSVVWPPPMRYLWCQVYFQNTEKILWNLSTRKHWLHQKVQFSGSIWRR